MAQTRAQKAAAAAKAAKAARKAAPETPEAAAAAANASVPASTAAAPTIHKPDKVAGENQSVVFIASKIPRGLYLDIFKRVEQVVPTKGGFEKQVSQMRTPDRIRVKPAVLAAGLTPTYPIVSGFSITRGVPAAHWRAWVEQNPQYEPYTMGLVRAFDSEADAIAYANEYEGMRTGLEPLNQDKDDRVMTSNSQNVGDVEIDSETPRPKS